MEDQADYIADAKAMLGQGYDHPELPEGFNSPNFTQSPNDFYDHYLKQIDTLAELKVVAAFIRFTFGYHRGAFRMGIDELAEYTGLAPNSVRTGAEAAEKRKLLRRSNPQENKKAEWELYVQNPEESRPAKFAVQGLKCRPAKFEGLSGVKESIKEKEPLSQEETEQANRKMDSYLQLSQAPGLKKIARLDAILSYLGPALGINSETKRWKQFAEFVDERQQMHGEKVEVFIGWVTSQPKYDIQFWPPSRMMELWPQAFRTSPPEAPRQKTELEQFLEKEKRNGK